MSRMQHVLCVDVILFMHVRMVDVYMGGSGQGKVLCACPRLCCESIASKPLSMAERIKAIDADGVKDFITEAGVCDEKKYISCRAQGKVTTSRGWCMCEALSPSTVKASRILTKARRS